MSSKVGEQNYDLGRFMQRGTHEIGGILYPDSPAMVRDYSGMYSRAEQKEGEPHVNRDVEPHAEREAEHAEPEHDEPELDC